MKKSQAAKKFFLIIILALTAIAILLLAGKLFGDDGESGRRLSSNAMRVEFLNQCGLIVSPDADIQEITVPSRFGDIYEEYSRLQESQGFDLKKYAGRKATLYRYTVLNCPDHEENVTANLLICGETLIACDMTLNEENGFTEPLL